jgi:putative ABC transport system permease protein
MGISQSLTGEMERYNPYDATYSIYLTEDIYDEETGEHIDSNNLEINVTDIPVESYAEKIAEVKIYNSNITLPLYDEDLAFICDLMKLSDYNKLLEMQNKPAVSLSENEFILNCTDNIYMEKFLEYFDKNKIYAGETEITLKNMDDTVIYNTSSKAGYGITLVLPDKLVENYRLRANMIAVNYIDSTHEYDKLFYEATDKVRANIKKISDERINLGFFTHLSSRMSNFEENKSISVTIAYLAVYLGIVFLIISAVVLAITQLSEASDNIARYEFLRKIGTDGNMINKALFVQIAIYFIVTLLLAVIHSVIGIKVASNIVLLIGDRNILRDSVFTAAIIIVIYGGYFLATYFGSRRIITKEY